MDGALSVLLDANDAEVARLIVHPPHSVSDVALNTFGVEHLGRGALDALSVTVKCLVVIVIKVNAVLRENDALDVRYGRVASVFSPASPDAHQLTIGVLRPLHALGHEARADGIDGLVRHFVQLLISHAPHGDVSPHDGAPQLVQALSVAVALRHELDDAQMIPVRHAPSLSSRRCCMSSMSSTRTSHRLMLWPSRW